MKFTFKIGEKIKEAWPLYKEHWMVLVMLTVISFIIQLGNYKKNSFLLGILVSLVGLVVSYVLIRLILSIVDKKEYNPFSKNSIPTIFQYWNYLKTSILYGFCILGGFILLIIPGFYVMGRLSFSVYLSVEKNQGARASIKESWDATKDYGWTLFWKSFIIGLFIVAGYLLFFIGSFITYPLGMLVFVMMYREFFKIKSQNPLNVIPTEISSESPNKSKIEELSKEEIK